MTARLYRVDVEFTYYIMAESADEATAAAREVASDLDLSDCGCAVEVKHDDTSEWDDTDALVYGSDDDLTLADAWPKPPEPPPAMFPSLVARVPE